jgi:hypothetical protein
MTLRAGEAKRMSVGALFRIATIDFPAPANDGPHFYTAIADAGARVAATYR